MDIEFTDEQKILQDSVERMLRASYDFDRRRAIIVARTAGASHTGRNSPISACSLRRFPRSRAVSAVDRSQP